MKPSERDMETLWTIFAMINLKLFQSKIKIKNKISKSIDSKFSVLILPPKPSIFVIITEVNYINVYKILQSIKSGVKIINIVKYMPSTFFNLIIFPQYFDIYYWNFHWLEINIFV